MDFASSGYLQLVTQEEVRSSMETYSEMDMLFMKLNKVPMLWSKLRGLSMNIWHDLR